MCFYKKVIESSVAQVSRCVEVIGFGKLVGVVKWVAPTYSEWEHVRGERAVMADWEGSTGAPS
jgi:hypothetical protein